MEEKHEHRHPVTCDACGKEMKFHKGLMGSPEDGAVYLEYICPRRSGEQGCGAIKNVRLEKKSKASYRRTIHNLFLRA